MARCLLSYSSAYSHLKDPFRNLLQVLGFEVNVFDEPDISRSPREIVEERIREVDAVVILYGPSDKNTFEGAEWPHREADIAFVQGKQLALITHPKVKLPLMLEHYQTTPHFDFWDAEDFRDNVHHVVKHLQDLKRRVDMPPGRQPYYFKNAVYRYRISDSGLKTTICAESDVVARERCSRFMHGIDTGADSTCAADFGEDGCNVSVVEVAPANDFHRVSLTRSNPTAHQFQYYIDVDPPLKPGERFGYRRTFTVPNRFPLSSTELDDRSRRGGFPPLPRGFYGERFQTYYETRQALLVIQFPKRVKIEETKVFVVHSVSHEENKEEAKRCAGSLSVREEVAAVERVIELNVMSPILNYNYYLLYRPGD